ncbi:MAG: hypothetical protein VX527_12615 [Planctomycetota bacterium]|nr:hypothetical protein [Planctomycetota bacterium]
MIYLLKEVTGELTMLLRISVLTCLLIILPGCDDKSKSSEKDAKASTSTTTVIPSSHFASNRPADVKDLAEVKKAAKKGEEVVFLARVGGKADPFVESHAIFLAADPKLLSCELMADDDHCSVPEDYCCEDPDNLKAGLATIQFVDDKGQPIKTTAMGAGGLEPLKFIVVNGIVREKNNDGLFIVDAETVWVGGKPSFKDPLAGSVAR